MKVFRSHEMPGIKQINSVVFLLVQHCAGIPDNSFEKNPSEL